MESRRLADEEDPGAGGKTYAVHFHPRFAPRPLDLRIVCSELGKGSGLANAGDAKRSGLRYWSSTPMPDIFWRGFVRLLASGHQRIFHPLPVPQPVGEVLSGRDGTGAECTAVHGIFGSRQFSSRQPENSCWLERSQRRAAAADFEYPLKRRAGQRTRTTEAKSPFLCADADPWRIYAAASRQAGRGCNLAADEKTGGKLA